MRNKNMIYKLSMLAVIGFAALLPTYAQQKTSESTVPARMTVTLQVLGDNKRMPEVTREDVIVRQGKDRLQVTGWTPARGDRAGLDLFILIDETTSSSLGSQLDDLRGFINAQPTTTFVGVGYMRNGTVQITQNFTSDHGMAAKALRLPIASSSIYGSPYLSVIDLMKRWPEGSNRREVIMVTDGIDRFRGGTRYSGLNSINPDVDAASTVAQRTGTIIHTIFNRGVGHMGRNFWEITNGQNSISKLSEETGGEAYYVGTQSPVSFRPFLDDVQANLNNQYLLEFQAWPGKKAALQRVKLTTEVAGVELNSADNVWVAPNSSPSAGVSSVGNSIVASSAH